MAEFDHAIEPEKMVEDVIGTLVTENEDSSNAGKDVEEESKALLGESKSEQERSAGIVIRWSHRGYGFVRPDDGGDDVFVHFSSIQDGNALKLDSKVEFLKVYDDRKGKYRGENVTGGFEDAPPDAKFEGATPANYAPLPVGGFGVGYTSEAPVPTMVPHDAMYGGHGAQW
eukprot:g3094.t1